MKAITIHRPWSWAIAQGFKGVENRTWRPGARVVGSRIAIHAGRRYDPEARLWIRHACGIVVPDETECPTGIVAIATIDRVVDQSDSPWFVGPIGWVLVDVEALANPIPCPGAQGLWDVPNEIAEILSHELTVKKFRC